eukprot:COSAG06_NODE_3811_length_4884_cov_11.896134_5_plen_95_part_00
MDKKRPLFLQGFDSNFIPFNVEGRNGATLADKFGANEGNNFQMTRPATLWGIHVHEMPNFCTQARALPYLLLLFLCCSLCYCCVLFLELCCAIA